MKITVIIPQAIYDSAIKPILSDLPQTKRAAIYRAALVSGAALAATKGREGLREWLYNFSEGDELKEPITGVPVRDKPPTKNETATKKPRGRRV